MIVVTVELRSAISRDRDKLLGIATITNVGVSAGGEPRFCIYDATLSKMAPKERKAWKRQKTAVDAALAEDVAAMEWFNATVERFDRERRGCWDLLYQVLKQIVGGRNP